MALLRLLRKLLLRKKLKKSRRSLKLKALRLLLSNLKPEDYNFNMAI